MADQIDEIVHDFEAAISGRIGRARAVCDVRGITFSGFVAWLTWLVLHLWYLIGFQNRIVVVIRWSFSFITRGRSSRLITGDPPPSPSG